MSMSSTATVSLASIATDLGLHIWNYGVPMPTSVEFFNSEKGLAFAGTVGGITATSVVGGVQSNEMETAFGALKNDYQRKILKVMIASSVINAKMLTQAGVGAIYMMAFSSSRENVMSWISKQLIPSLLVHGAMAGTIPYFM